ncbi:hypothetical protein MD484_g445, partial [Candolleomyces efflorescens]
MHITSKDGAFFTIIWRGTGIQLQGNVANATYTINLDGNSVNNTGANGQDVLATIIDLDDEDHMLTLTAQIPNADPPDSSTIALNRALILSIPPNATNTSSARPVFLDDQMVGFHGRWNFGAEDDVTFHQSNSVGDRATATFRAFVLYGTTSPEAGNYSVTVNNQTVFYSAKSSFLEHDTLLHYSTGLDPNTNHTVTVKNEGGGTLSLLEGGFGVYGSDSQTAPSPSPTPVGAATAFPKGTIAAFVLAGILAFLLFSAFLYFWFIYRPRKNYQLQRERWRNSHQFRTGKSAEADDVLDIGPTAPARPERELTFTFISERTPSDRSPPTGPQRGSGKNSFSRWKREVEHAVARDSLGIQFRHSSLYDEKHEGPRDAGTVQSTSDAISSRSSPSVLRNAMFMMGIGRHSRTSSSNSKRHGRNKGKESKRVSDNRSWSPGYHINIPFQPPSQEERVPTRTQTSLSYLTAPLGFEAEAREPAPPSYAASISHRESDSPPSVPRSVTHSSSIPTVIQPQDKGKARASSEDRLRDQPASPVTSYTSSLTPPFPVRDLSKEDRGSVMDQSIDETPAVLSGPAVRRLIRSLSPRTSKASFPQQHNPLSLDLASIPLRPPNIATQQLDSPQQQRTPRPLPKPPNTAPLPSPTRSDTQEGPGAQSEPVSPSTEEMGVSALSGPVRSSGTFGPRPSSSGTRTQEGNTPLSSQVPISPPSTLSPPGTGQQTQWSSTPSSTSQRFSGRFSNRTSRLVPRTDVALGSLRQPFRLTPLQPLAEQQTSTARHSFLDMTSSSDVSAHSKENTDSSSLRGDTRRYSTPPSGLLNLPEERSRWSSSNSAHVSMDQQEHDNDDGNEPRDDNDTSIFTKPQSTPAPLIIPSAAQFLLPARREARVSISETSTRSDPVHVHPNLEPLESPTDSLPFTVSDVDFRLGSDSEEIPAIARGRLILEGQSVRTSGSSMYVPAVPSPPEPQSEGEDAASPTPPPALSSPNYLVQRNRLKLGFHDDSLRFGAL